MHDGRSPANRDACMTCLQLGVPGLCICRTDKAGMTGGVRRARRVDEVGETRFRYAVSMRDFFRRGFRLPQRWGLRSSGLPNFHAGGASVAKA